MIPMLTSKLSNHDLRSATNFLSNSLEENLAETWYCVKSLPSIPSYRANEENFLLNKAYTSPSCVFICTKVQEDNNLPAFLCIVANFMIWQMQREKKNYAQVPYPCNTCTRTVGMGCTTDFYIPSTLQKVADRTYMSLVIKLSLSKGKLAGWRKWWLPKQPSEFVLVFFQILTEFHTKEKSLLDLFKWMWDQEFLEGALLWVTWHIHLYFTSDQI